MSWVDRRITVFDIFVYIYMFWVLMDGMHHFAWQITVTMSPWRSMQLSAISEFGWRRWDNLRNADVHVF